jgi:arylsulfatase A-like enzyme
MTAVVVLGFGMRAWKWGGERLAISRLSTLSAVPNVLLLVLDTVRAQDLSLYGYTRPTTPNLDTRARAGVTFDRVVAPAPWTLPSHASLFSGRFHPDVIWKQPVPWTHPTLAEILAKHGYVTGGFVANLYYGIEYFDLNRGFHHYEDYPLSWRVITQASWASRYLAGRVRTVFKLQEREFVRKTAADVNQGFLDWASRTEGLPFFAFLNYIDAHDPYYPPEPFDRRFAEPGVRARHRLGRTGHRYTGEEVRALRNSYDGAIAYIDQEVESLLEELEQRGVLDNTIVIITSDHGEEFAEHGVMGHSMSLYFPSLYVPLVIVFPSRVPENTRVDQSVGLLDIPATILDLIGMDPAGYVPGSSLARFWDPDTDSTPESAVILSESLPKQDFTPPLSYPIHHGLMRSLIVDNLHYIQDGRGREELFDVAADPWEYSNLTMSADHLPQLERFRALLKAAFSDERQRLSPKP